MTVSQRLQQFRDEAKTATPIRVSRDHLLHRGDELEFAELVAKDIEASRQWVFATDCFWEFNGTSWHPKDKHEVRRHMMLYGGIKQQVATRKKKIKAAQAAEGEPQPEDEVVSEPVVIPLRIGNRFIEGSARLVESKWSRPRFFDEAPRGVAFANCFVTVDAENVVQELPHAPNHRARACLPYRYEERKTPVFFQYLRDIWGDDPDGANKIMFLRAFIGSCLLGTVTRYDKVCVLDGKGGNGKSVFFQLIAQLFDDSVRTALPPHQWGDPYYLATLFRSQINIVPEVSDKELLATGVIKAVVTGDEVTARSPYKEPFSFCPRGGHLLSWNAMPAVDDFSDGFWRRWCILKLTRKFEEDARDRQQFVSELSVELPGIAHWAIEGARLALLQKRLPKVPSSDAAVLAWRQKTDQVASFVASCCYATAGTVGARKKGMDPEHLYRAYDRWHGVVGKRNKIDLFKFTERLSSLGYGEDPETGNILLWCERHKDQVSA